MSFFSKLFNLPSKEDLEETNKEIVILTEQLSKLTDAIISAETRLATVEDHLNSHLENDFYTLGDLIGTNKQNIAKLETQVAELKTEVDALSATQKDEPSEEETPKEDSKPEEEESPKEEDKDTSKDGNEEVITPGEDTEVVVPPAEEEVVPPTDEKEEEESPEEDGTVKDEESNDTTGSEEEETVEVKVSEDSDKEIDIHVNDDVVAPGESVEVVNGDSLKIYAEAKDASTQDKVVLEIE